MSAVAPPFPAPIRRYLSDFVAHSRRVRVARAVLLAGAVVLAWTLAVAGVDRFLPLPTWLRATLLVLELAGAAAILWQPLRSALRRHVDWVEASAQVERRAAGTLGQRLVTVTSQLLAPSSLRGSPQFVDALVQQVSTDIARTAPLRLVNWRTLARPAVAAVCLAVAAAGLWGLAWLNLPQLIDRQLRPFSGTPPVTTTQIDVTPAGASVREREPLTITAVVRHMQGTRLPTLYVAVGADATQWDAIPMTPGAEHVYTHTLPPVEQDLRFYVSAGDATTPTYAVRALRRPAVAEYRIRYAYPAYTGRAPLSVRNTDGLVEAPQKTEAVIAIAATEPLTRAALKVNGAWTELTPTSDARVRQLRLTIAKDQSCELQMTTDRGVEGAVAKAIQIRAVPDRPPLVRILQPVADLRLTPRDTVPISYQALDDYGVARLVARAQVNANPPVEYTLRPRALASATAGGPDTRRIEGAFELDLAALDVKVGDVVSITLAATDRANQPGTSDVRHVLVSPRSIDVVTHQRLAELAQAADYARDFAAQLAQARQAVDQARRTDADHDADRSAAIARVSRLLSVAQETGALLRQSLLRTIVYSASPRMSDGLASGVDAAADQLDNVDRVDETIASRRAADDAVAGRLARTATAAAELADRIRRFAAGEQAAAVIADRYNLTHNPATAPTDAPARDRRRQMLQRAAEEIDAACRALDIDPKNPSVDAQLQQKVDDAARVLQAAKPVDLVTAAHRWVAGVRSGEFQPPHFDERLAAAAQAEAVRPDAEMLAARDLQTASRAAARLAQPPAPTPDHSVDEFDDEPAAPVNDPAQARQRDDALTQFPDALAALRAEHAVNRRALDAHSPSEFRRIHDAARDVHAAGAAARARMLAWSARPGTTPDQMTARAREAEEIAIAAGVATESKDFDAAADLDRKLAATLGRPDLADASAAPRAIDKLANNQERLADQTAAASAEDDQAAAAAIAGIQKQVADDIGQAQASALGAGADVTPDSAEARQRATEAITQAQEKLAALPMQLSNAQQSAAAVAEVAARLSAARDEAATAPAPRRESAERIVEMVQSEVDDAQRSFDSAVKPFQDRLADDLVDALRPFAPDTAAALAAVDEPFKSSLADLRQSLARAAQNGDVDGIEPAAQRARDAIARAQDALRDAQARVIERDPLVSARWFARAAADALTAAPPNRRTASAHQRQTLDALSRAALDALRRSKNARLAQVPTYSPFYLPPLPGPWSAAADDRDPQQADAANPRLLQTLPGLREWGRLRDRLGDSLDAPVRESEPTGYSDALRLYFEILNKEDTPKPAPK